MGHSESLGCVGPIDRPSQDPEAIFGSSAGGTELYRGRKAILEPAFGPIAVANKARSIPTDHLMADPISLTIVTYWRTCKVSCRAQNPGERPRAGSEDVWSKARVASFRGAQVASSYCAEFGRKAL